MTSLSRSQTKIHQKFTLEDQKNLQLRNVRYAVRDSLLIVGVVAQ